MQALVKQHLLRAQARMKKQVDKGHIEHTFVVGDMVFLKLQLFIQSSVARCSHNKLRFKFFGPYKIIQCIRAMIYKLELPSFATIHDVFHVS